VSRKVHVNGLEQFINEREIEYANVKILNQPDGFFVAVTTYTPKTNFKEKEKVKKSIGIDFGIKHSLTTSEGETMDCSVEETESLKKASKRMNHCVKGSNNRMRNRKKLRKCYQKINNRRTDMANRIVSKLKRYSRVVIQDEQLKNWHKGLFGKQIQHSCLGRIKSKLKTLPNVVVLDRFIPTSKVCMKCGKAHELKLSDRVFSCKCGISEDRDVRAAKNMLEIVDMINVPPEQREVKRAEFLASFQKKFGISYGTVKHEDATF
jgi:Transposase and inactivated derivatives